MNLLIIINNILKPSFFNKVNIKSIIIIWKGINNNVININEL